MTAQLLVAEARLRPGLAVSAVGFSSFLKVRQSSLAIILGKKTKTVAKVFDGASPFVASGGRDQIAERHWLRPVGLRRATKLRNALRGNRKVDALAAGD